MYSEEEGNKEIWWNSQKDEGSRLGFCEKRCLGKRAVATAKGKTSAELCKVRQ